MELAVLGRSQARWPRFRADNLCIFIAGCQRVGGARWRARHGRSRRSDRHRQCPLKSQHFVSVNRFVLGIRLFAGRLGFCRAICRCNGWNSSFNWEEGCWLNWGLAQSGILAPIHGGHNDIEVRLGAFAYQLLHFRQFRAVIAQIRGDVDHHQIASAALVQGENLKLVARCQNPNFHQRFAHCPVQLITPGQCLGSQLLPHCGIF